MTNKEHQNHLKPHLANDMNLVFAAHVHVVLGTVEPQKLGPFTHKFPKSDGMDELQATAPWPMPLMISPCESKGLGPISSNPPTCQLPMVITTRPQSMCLAQQEYHLLRLPLPHPLRTGPTDWNPLAPTVGSNPEARVQNSARHQPDYGHS